MSIKHHNGTITLTSFADLGSVLDLTTLPSGFETVAEATEVGQSFQGIITSRPLQPGDLAGLAAEVSRITSGLDAIARQDALARDRAELDLALYDALLADKQQAESALAQVRRVK